MNRKTTLLCSALLALAPGPLSALSLLAHQSYATGAGPVALASADLDGDGDIDLAVLDGDDATLTLLTNDGAAGFATAAVTLGASPGDIASGDFDGDGDTDLAIANLGDDTITVLLNGGGTFTEAAGSPLAAAVTGTKPGALIAADIDGDGNLDLAVAHRAASATPRISILAGNGDGTFQGPWEKEVGLVPGDLVAADFDGDGDTDLVVANSQGSSLSFLAGGGGTLADRIDTPLDFRPTVMASGDFDEDGLPDLAILQLNDGEGSSRLHVLLNAGDGTFAPATVASYPAGVTPAGLTLFDSDGDGHLDLFVASLDSNTFQRLGGKGDGTFVLDEHLYSAGAGPIALASADFDGDGATDLAIAANRENRVGIVLGLGDGHFATATVRPLSTTAPRTLVRGDFDGDGRTDLARIAPGGGRLELRLRRDGDTFAPTVTVALPANAVALTSGRFDGDERDDLAVIHRGSNRVTVLLAGPGGVLTEGPAYTLVTTPVADPGDIASADFDGDGDSDLAIAVTNADLVVVAPASGDGTFGDAIALAVGSGPKQVVVHDIDANGRPDLATLNGDDTLSILVNGGGLAFSEARDEAIEGRVRALVTEDFDRNGESDFLVTFEEHLDMTVYSGNINGTVDPPLPFPLGQFSTRLASGDFNRDSIPDLAAIIEGSSSILFLYGNGDATFRPGVNAGLGNGALPVALTALDANGDGRSELAVSDGKSGLLYFLDANDENPFSLRATYKPAPLPGPEAGEIVALDFDGDGNLDLAIANTSRDNIGLLRGNGEGDFDNDLVSGETGAEPVALTSADFDGDGRPDLASANRDAGGQNVSVLLNAGGTFPEAVHYALAGSATAPASIAHGDLDNDGVTDLIVATPEDDTLSVLIGDGANPGAFLPAVALAAPVSAPTRVSADDLDQDGDIDLVITSSGDEQLVVLLNDGLAATLSFTPLNGGIAAGTAPRSHLVADLDMDGGAEIVTGGRDITVVRNLGNFMPDPFEIAPVTDAPISIPGVDPVTTTVAGVEVVVTPGVDPVERLIDSAPVTISGLTGPARIAVEGGWYSVNGGPFTDRPGSVASGDSVVVRLVSAFSAATTTHAVLTVGGYSDRFEVTTLDDGTRPDPFAFEEVVDAELDSYIDSAPVTVSGLTAPARISVRGGWYSVNGGPFTTAVGQVEAGDTVVARIRTLPIPEGYQAVSTATVTIGGVSADFTVTAKADLSPDPFSFPDKYYTKLSTLALSPWTVIKGITAPTPISVEGGRYAIINDPQNFTDEPGFVENGQKIRIAVVSASTYNTPIEVKVTVGDYTTVFKVVTKEGDEPEEAETDEEKGIEQQSLLGCTMGAPAADGSLDPTLALIVLLSAVALWRRENRRQRSAR